MTKGTIPIKAAERLSKEHGCPVVLVFAIEPGGGFSVVTYGKTKKLCKLAADLGKKFAEAILNGTVEPAASEPPGLPEEPAAWDGVRKGWCNEHGG